MSSAFTERIALSSSKAALALRASDSTTDITVKTFPPSGICSHFKRGILRTGINADKTFTSKYSTGKNAVNNTAKNVNAASAAP